MIWIKLISLYLLDGKSLAELGVQNYMKYTEVHESIWKYIKLHGRI